MKRVSAALIIAFALTGCGTRVLPGATAVSGFSIDAQARKATPNGTKRTAPPTAKKPAAPPPNAGTSRVYQYCATALAQYRVLQSEWNAADSDVAKDQIELKMRDVLHKALDSTWKSVALDPNASIPDRRSKFMADDELSLYSAFNERWQASKDDKLKRTIMKLMLKGMVETVEEILTNY